jgi:hypothetical protein
MFPFTFAISLRSIVLSHLISRSLVANPLQTIWERVQELERDLKGANQDLDAEKSSRRHWQAQCEDKQQEITTLRNSIANNCFVQVLIDGDGAYFHDMFVEDGPSGGAKAASLLHIEIKKHIESLYPGSDLPIMVNMYASLGGIAGKLTETGVINRPSDIHDFVRGFNTSQDLFNIIDVGAGKEKADHKVRGSFQYFGYISSVQLTWKTEMFRIFLANKQCKHIIFAGLHDNGYLNILKPYEHDSDTASRITLLETLPAQKEYRTLGLKLVSFDNVFRKNAFYQVSSPPKRAINPRPTTITPPSTTPSPGPTSASNLKPGLAQTDSSSWATATKNGAQSKVASIAPTKISAPVYGTTYLVNADEQRIDDKLPFLKNSDREDLKNLTKTTKLCNQFYLQNYCPKKGKCPFSHTIKLSPSQILALRHQARNIECKQGLGCYDETCYFGHSCPSEVRLGSGNCERGDDCYFYKRHGIDLVSILPSFSKLIAC